MRRRSLLRGVNLLPSPRTPGGAGWGRAGISAPVLAPGPSGVADTASILTETATTEQHYIGSPGAPFEAGRVYTLTACVAPEASSLIQMTFQSAVVSPAAFQNFSLAGAGSLGSGGGGTGFRASIREAAGWYLCSLTAVASTTSIGQAFVALIDSASAPRSVVYLGTNRSVRIAWVALENTPVSRIPLLGP